MGLSAGSTRARCKGTALLWHCAFLRLGRGDHGLGGPRTEGLASRLCGSQRQPGGLRPKAARGWAGSEGSDRVKELGRAGPSRAERGHAPTAAIMGWRGPGEGGGEVGEGRASSGYYGMVRPSAAGEGRESRDYYGMARPSATGGGQVGGRSIMGWRALLRRRGGGGILWDGGAPRGGGSSSGAGGGERGGGGCGYYGMAGPFAARASGVLWGGTIPSACARAAIMGWRCTYCLPAKYYGMQRAGGGERYYGMPAQHGAGRGLQLRPPCLGAHRVPPVLACPRPVPSHRGAPRPLPGPPAVHSP